MWLLLLEALAGLALLLFFVWWTLPIGKTRPNASRSRPNTRGTDENHPTQ